MWVILIVHKGVLIIFIVNINVYILGFLIIPKFDTFEHILHFKKKSLSCFFTIKHKIKTKLWKRMGERPKLGTFDSQDVRTVNSHVSFLPLPPLGVRR